MNKKYIKPELEITEISAANIIATSLYKTTTEAADKDYQTGGDAKMIKNTYEIVEW